MGARISRRGFLRTAGGIVVTIPLEATGSPAIGAFHLGEHPTTASAHLMIALSTSHVHFDDNKPNFIQNLVTLSERTNLTVSA
jgi:hypothetical protein